MSTPARQSGTGGIHGFPAYNGFQNTYVAQIGGIDFQRIGVEDHKVGQLAGLDGALGVFLEILPRGVKGMGAQGFEHGNALIRTKDLTGGCQAVDADPNGQQRIGGDDGGVAVRGNHEAAIQRGAHGVHPGGAFRAKEQIPVAVAPVIDMGGEERRRVARRFEAIELFLADRLGMDQDVAAILAGMFGLRGFKRIKGVVGGGIAVGMDEELPTPMRGFDQRDSRGCAWDSPAIRGRPDTGCGRVW